MFASGNDYGAVLATVIRAMLLVDYSLERQTISAESLELIALQHGHNY